jgi:mRNA interferase MazF
MARDLRHGDVRLYRFARPDKERPVLVMTRQSALAFLTRVTVAPISTTVRGAPTELVLDVADGMKTRCAVNLDHLITVPRASLGRWLTTLDGRRMRETCAALAFAVGCDRAS